MAVTEAELIEVSGFDVTSGVLIQVGGELIVNRVGDDTDIATFIDGLEHLDQLVAGHEGVSKPLGRNAIRGFIENNVHGRSVLQREGQLLIALTIHEPLQGHPAYNPEAERQYYFNGHYYKVRNAECTASQHMLPPERRYIRPFLELGQHHVPSTRLW